MRKQQRQIGLCGTKHTKKKLLEPGRNSAMQVAAWINFNSLKVTLMQIWKSPYMFVFI